MSSYQQPYHNYGPLNDIHAGSNVTWADVLEVQRLYFRGWKDKQSRAYTQTVVVALSKQNISLSLSEKNKVLTDKLIEALCCFVSWRLAPADSTVSQHSRTSVYGNEKFQTKLVHPFTCALTKPHILPSLHHKASYFWCVLVLWETMLYHRHHLCLLGSKRALGTKKEGKGFKLPSHIKALSPQTHIMGTRGAYTNRISGESDVDR